ncbi:MAG: hypothetical protein LUE98_04580 [Tannerellaceae bacterium]|nr:hypothetical protein [Tannerellaceae bacterium]
MATNITLKRINSGDTGSTVANTIYENDNALLGAINNIAVGLVHKGSVPSVSNLPTSGNTRGDAYFVEDSVDPETGKPYIWQWDGEKWNNTMLTDFSSNMVSKGDLVDLETDIIDTSSFYNESNNPVLIFKEEDFEQGYWLSYAGTITTDSTFFRTKDKQIIPSSGFIVLETSTYYDNLQVIVDYYTQNESYLGYITWRTPFNGIMSVISSDFALAKYFKLSIGLIGGGSFEQNIQFKAYPINLRDTYDTENGTWYISPTINDKFAVRNISPLSCGDIQYINIEFIDNSEVLVLIDYLDFNLSILSRSTVWETGMFNTFKLSKPANATYINLTIKKSNSTAISANDVKITPIRPVIPDNWSIYNNIVSGSYLANGTIISGLCRTFRPLPLLSNLLYLDFGTHTNEIRIIPIFLNAIGMVITTSYTWINVANNQINLSPPSGAVAVHLTIGSIHNYVHTDFFKGVISYKKIIREVTVSAIRSDATYSSLEEVFENEKEGELNIYLYDELYDIMNRTLDVKEGWNFIGIGAENTFLRYHTDGIYDEGSGFDSGLLARSNCSFRNMSIQAYDTSVYALHIDNINLKRSFDVLIENCIIERLEDTIDKFINDTTNGGQALGVGLGCSQSIHVYNSKIIPKPADAICSCGVNLHNWDDNGLGLPAIFDFRNCFIGGMYGVVFGNFKNTSAKGQVRDVVNFINCNIPGGISIETNGNNINNSWLFNFTGTFCPEIKTGGNNFLSIPETDTCKYMMNMGHHTIIKGDILCYVYKQKKTSWHSGYDYDYDIPVGVEKLSETNYKSFAGIALNDFQTQKYGYVQTGNLAAIGNNINAALYDFIVVNENGILVDNNSPHYIGQIVRKSWNEIIMKINN